MKYTRLSKEQLEELYQEFINFLATQSITAKEWEEIKLNKPEVAEQEIDVFSDLIWEGVLNNASYIEHWSKDQIHLFDVSEDEMKLIALKVNKPIDLMDTKDFQWLMNNLGNDLVDIFQAAKKYGNDKNADKFDLIKKGGTITKGELYKTLADFIAK